MLTALPAAIPSPDQNVWQLGPLPLRAYALCIIAGIVVAVWLGGKRWVARGGSPSAVGDIAIWAVPFGIIGGRLYHVITDNQLYFGEGRNPWKVFEIWGGGLGIWGAIALGGVGAWIGCRRKGIPLPAMADALAPGILFAQAIGRWGNWFNQELFGKPTDLPWGLEIDSRYRPDGFEDVATFHPTFLYESLWCAGLAVLLMWLDKRFRMGHGRVFALYVAGYTVGRAIWEYLRIDPANEIFGVRVNLWVSGLVFLGAVAYFVVSLRRRPGREAPEDLVGFYEDADPFADTSSAASSSASPARADDESSDDPDPDAATTPADAEVGDPEPDDAKPDSAKPGDAKPGDAKPDHAKPDHAKVDGGDTAGSADETSDGGAR
ncbi:MAG TPA: prolipoprotein diacylglyceryl transferase [Jiangellaceae bacterium]